MGAPMRLAAFAAALIATFALSFGVGRAMEVDEADVAPAPMEDHDTGGSESHDDMDDMDDGDS